MGAARRRIAQGLLALLAACLGSAASAQVSAPITPGGVQDTLKRTPEVKPVVPLSSETQTDKAAPRNIAPATLGKTVTVQRFDFTGNTLYTSDQLNALVANYTGKPITLVQLYEATDHITEFYVKNGYTLASAVVPAQRITEGTVQIEIIEGRIARLKYEGLKRYRESDLNDILATSPGKIYRADDFEDRLRLADALPGLTVRARVQPGDDYGTSDVVVKAQEKTFEGSVFGDNAGSKSVGVFRYGAQLTVNNPLRAGDQLTLLGLRSRENLDASGEDGLLEYGSVLYSLPASPSNGARINLSYGYAQFHVLPPFATVSGKNRNAKAEYVHPLLSTATDQLNLVTDVNDTRANSDFTGITFSKTHVTVAEVGGNYIHSYADRSATQVSLLMGSNFQGYDVTDNSSQPFKVDVDFQQLTPLPNNFQLLARTNFVYGVAPLPDTQKFSIGGPGSVRGYAPSEARGDWGYLAQITLRHNKYFGPLLLSPRVFYDAGVTRQHRLDRFAPGSQLPELSLASYGIGADASVRNFSLKMDYAVPTTSTPVSDGKEDGRFYGALSVAF